MLEPDAVPQDTESGTTYRYVLSRREPRGASVPSPNNLTTHPNDERMSKPGTAQVLSRGLTPDQIDFVDGGVFFKHSGSPDPMDISPEKAGGGWFCRVNRWRYETALEGRGEGRGLD